MYYLGNSREERQLFWLCSILGGPILLLIVWESMILPFVREVILAPIKGRAIAPIIEQIKPLVADIIVPAGRYFGQPVASDESAFQGTVLNIDKLYRYIVFNDRNRDNNNNTFLNVKTQMLNDFFKELKDDAEVYSEMLKGSKYQQNNTVRGPYNRTKSSFHGYRDCAFSDWSLLTNDLFVVGKAVTWELKKAKLSPAYWALDKKIRGSANDRVFTVFLILMRDKVTRGKYTGNAQGYGDDAIVAAVLWPEKKVIAVRCLRSFPGDKIHVSALYEDCYYALGSEINKLPKLTYDQWKRRATELSLRSVNVEESNERACIQNSKEIGSIENTETAKRKIEEAEIRERHASDEMLRAKEEEKQMALRNAQALEMVRKQEEEIAFKERQRSEYMNQLRSTFVLPKVGVAVVLELKSGGKAEGILNRINDKCVVVRKGNATVSINRTDLSETSRVKLWAEDYVTVCLRKQNKGM